MRQERAAPSRSDYLRTAGGKDIMEEKARILIVDDNDSLCTAMSFVLSRKGYSVATANDGMKAIEWVRESPFDLILLDIKLPVMDGGGCPSDR